mmetsp:Transcript_23674/g.59412  ORF Transcript_23674/g.59412 Transcript_23674/m.59412 type:complete len:204 (-) Transcript_23674:345-956(-)
MGVTLCLRSPILIQLSMSTVLSSPLPDMFLTISLVLPCRQANASQDRDSPSPSPDLVLRHASAEIVIPSKTPVTLCSVCLSPSAAMRRGFLGSSNDAFSIENTSISPVSPIISAILVHNIGTVAPEDKMRGLPFVNMSPPGGIGRVITLKRMGLCSGPGYTLIPPTCFPSYANRQHPSDSLSPNLAEPSFDSEGNTWYPAWRS